MNATILRFSTAALLLLAARTARAADYKIVAYVPNWIDLPAFAQRIDYSKVTHINIAFENPVDAEGHLSFAKADETLISKAHANGRKVLVSLGGGAASGDKALQSRYWNLLTESKRAGFVASLSGYIAAHDLDGLDVDIEGPSINKDYGAFIADLAAALRPKGKLLTAALSEGYGGKSVPDSALLQLDWVNIMAYDAKGPWNANAPGQHSSREFAKSCVSYWLGRGLPKEKAVLGLPFYGYGFGKAFRKRDYPYREIATAFPGAEQRDETGSTIWYNGIPTVQAKAAFVKENALAGIMIWSLDLDADGPKSLLSAAYDSLRQ